MKNGEDLIAMAEWQIENFGRVSGKVSKELLKELKSAKEDAKNGSDWFNSYQCVDDFLTHHLGDRLPVNNDKPEQNTINAICILAGLIDLDK